MQDGEERVIAYVSKSLEGSEQRYCTARKELLAVVRALKHFKYGQKITVRTDNSAVSWLHRSKDQVGQPARWIELIDTYDITSQHRPGRKHGNADALSRYPCRQCQEAGRQTVMVAPDGPSEPEIRLETTGGTQLRRQGPQAAGRGRKHQPVGADGSYHSTRKGWKHQQPLGEGPVGELEWTRQDVGPAEEHGWRRQRTGWYYIRNANSSRRSVQSSESNELPASQPVHSEASRMTGRGDRNREQVPCPKCGKRVQRQYMRKHNRNIHQGGRRRKHTCPYCSADMARTYSTFLDWKNHLSTTHGHCMEAEDLLWREEYAAGFKLDQWGRFHELDGSETNRAYQRVRNLREQYGRYQGQGEGQPPGPPSTIRLPYTKGTTPDKDMTPAESDLAGSERGESGPEEGEVQQEEDNDPGSLLQRGRGTLIRNPRTPPRDGTLGGAPVAGRRYC